MSRLHCLSLAAFVLLSVWLPAWSQEWPSSLRDALHHAWTAHPSVAVAERALEGAETRLDLAGRWDDPTLEVAVRDDLIDGGDGAGTVEAMVSQPIPLGGRVRHERALGEQELALARWELAEVRRRLAFEVECAVHAWLAARETIEDDEAILAIHREVADFLARQVARGEASSLDVAAMEMMARELQLDVQRAESDARSALRRLRQAMGWVVPVDAAAGPQAWEMLPDPSLEAPLDAILARRPDAQLAALRIAAAGAQARLERARRWEDAGVGLMVESDYGGEDDATLLGAGILLPLPIWNRNQGLVQEAATRAVIAQEELEHLRFAIAREVEDVRAILQDARERFRQMEDVLQPAEEQRQASIRKAYEQGQIGFIELRQARERWVRLRSEARAARAAVREASARLRFVQSEYPISFSDYHQE